MDLFLSSYEISFAAPNKVHRDYNSDTFQVFQVMIICIMMVVIIILAPVVQRVDSAMHWINHYSLDNSIGFASVHLLNSDLSGG